MNLIDPVGPPSLDELVSLAEPSRIHGGYGEALPYQPYAWEAPWAKTPQPAMPPFEGPQHESAAPLRYEDCLLTPDLFARAVRDLNG